MGLTAPPFLTMLKKLQNWKRGTSLIISFLPWMCDVPKSSCFIGWLIYYQYNYSFLKIKMGGRDVEGFVTTDLEKLAAT